MCVKPVVDFCFKDNSRLFHPRTVAEIDAGPEVQPYRLLTVAELGYEASHEQAGSDIGRRIDAQHAKCCTQHPCCRRLTGAFRDTTNARGRGFAIAFRCKRLDCADCQRKLIVDNLKLARSAMLRGVNNLLHVALVPWRNWRSLSRSVERYGKGAGYVRIRHDIGLVMVVSEKPFPGSTAMAAGSACGMAAGAIERADKVRQSIAWCGRWKDLKPKKGKKFQQVEIGVSVEEAMKLAEEYQAKARRIKGAAIGIGWIFAPDADPVRIAEFYRKLACRTSDVWIEGEKNTVSSATAVCSRPAGSIPDKQADTGPPPDVGRLPRSA